MNITTHTHYLSAEDKMTVLRAIGERWDELIRDFERGPNPISATFLTEQFLFNAVKGYAHPSLSGEQIMHDMLALRDALTDLRRFECFDQLPDTMADDDRFASYDQQAVLDTLNRDVDACLFLIVAGMDMTQVCITCRRTDASPWSWQRREQGSSFCIADQPVRATFMQEGQR